MARLSGRTRGSGVPSIPLQRLGWVKEIADATIYLFSDSGNYVTGSTVVGEYLARIPQVAPNSVS